MTSNSGTPHRPIGTSRGHALTYSISKSIVSRRRVADSALARQDEGNNDTIDLEMELRVGGTFSSLMEAKDGSFDFDFAGTYTKLVTNELIE